MRPAWILPVLLIMVLPEAFGIAMAAENAWPIITASRPAWPSIESPVLVMLGCILVGLAAWVRRTVRRS